MTRPQWRTRQMNQRRKRSQRSKLTLNRLSRPEMRNLSKLKMIAQSCAPKSSRLYAEPMVKPTTTSVSSVSPIVKTRAGKSRWLSGGLVNKSYRFDQRLIFPLNLRRSDPLSMHLFNPRDSLNQLDRDQPCLHNKGSLMQPTYHIKARGRLFLKHPGKLPLNSSNSRRFLKPEDGQYFYHSLRDLIQSKLWLKTALSDQQW